MEQFLDFLPVGSIISSYLPNTGYEVVKVISQDTFTITYLVNEIRNIEAYKRNGREESASIGSSFPTSNSNVKPFSSDMKQKILTELFIKDVNERVSDQVDCRLDSAEVFDKYKKIFFHKASALMAYPKHSPSRLLKLWEGNGTLYYTTNFDPQAVSLSDYLRQSGKVSECDTVKFTLNLTDALKIMHSYGAAHLNVNPKSISISNGAACIYGFTMGKIDESQLNGKRIPVAADKPGYMPLEYYSYIEPNVNGFGGGLETDAGIDIYGLSAVMFTMLSGKRPPEAYAILNDGFPVEVLRENGVSQELIEIIEKGMSAMKRQRYQAMEEFYDVLSAIARSYEIVNSPSSTGYNSTDENKEGKSWSGGFDSNANNHNTFDKSKTQSAPLARQKQYHGAEDINIQSKGKVLKDDNSSNLSDGKEGKQEDAPDQNRESKGGRRTDNVGRVEHSQNSACPMSETNQASNATRPVIFVTTSRGDNSIENFKASDNQGRFSHDEEGKGEREINESRREDKDSIAQCEEPIGEEANHKSASNLSQVDRGEEGNGANSESKTRTGNNPQSGSNSQSRQGTGSNSQSQSNSRTGFNPQSKQGTNAQKKQSSNSNSNTQPNSQSRQQPNSQSHSQSNTQPQSNSQPQSQSQSHSNSQSQFNPNHGSNSRPNPNSNPQLHPQSKQQTSSQPNSSSKPLTGEHYDHLWVDLGLPSGVRWALINIGATRLKKGGRHMAWGEVRPKFGYNPGNYNPINLYRTPFSSFSSDEDNDPAVELWGGGWRTPTKEEFEELIQYCDVAYISEWRKKGVIFKSRINGQSIFFPAVGDGLSQYYDRKEAEGCYWTSTSGGNEKEAFALKFGQSKRGQTHLGLAPALRYLGYSYRPVLDEAIALNPDPQSHLSDDYDPAADLKYEAGLFGELWDTKELMEEGESIYCSSGGYYS